MNGKIVIYHKYEGTSGKISIPTSIAESLIWEHKDDIVMTIEIVNGQKGLFLFKKETIVKYIFDKQDNKSIVIIPNSIIKRLKWIDKDILNIVNRSINSEDGLFLYKRGNIKDEKLYSYLDEYGRPVIPYYGVSSIDLYDIHFQIMIPRKIIGNSNLRWNNNDNMSLFIKTIEGQKGLFLAKKEE